MKKSKGIYSEGGLVGGDPIRKNKREVKTSKDAGVLVPMDDATREYNLVHDMAYLAANPDAFNTELGKSFFKRNTDNNVDPTVLQGIVTDLAIFNAREDVKGLTGSNRLNRFLSTPSNNPLVQQLKTNKKYNPAAMLMDSPDIEVQATEFANGGVAGSLLQQVPAIADSVIGLLENNPSAYSNQPTFSASTMRTMVSPYNSFALGGTITGDPVKDFFVEYMNSPNYKQRLTKSGYKNPDKTIKTRLKNLKSATETNIPGIGSKYTRSNNNVNIDNQELVEAGLDKESARVHEYSHAGGSLGFNGMSLIGDDLLNPNEIKLLSTNNKSTDVHDSMAGESKADMDVLRYHLKKNNIYNTGKETFNKKHLKMSKEKFKNNKTLNRLFDRYEDDELIMLMNTIASSNNGNNNGNPTAAYGMQVGTNMPIEVEGEEVIQTPNGELSKVKGPSHEEGGVNIAVPSGTKIYSDRLTVNGDTMQERKVKRVKKLEKLAKKLGDNPQDAILKNTFTKTIQNTQLEESRDMAVQQILNNPNQTFALGGLAGVDPDPVRRKMVSIMNNDPNAVLMGQNEMFGTTTPGLEDLTGVPNTSNIPLGSAGNRRIDVPASDVAAGEEIQGLGELGVGDIVGMAGTAFNAIAPLINSANAARNSRPNVNRFLGFGEDALQANQQAQGYVDQSRANQMTNLRTSTNAQLMRNRNSANSVNTLRALDISSGMAANQATAGIENSYNAQMMQLLGQQSELENIQDRVVMSGEQQRDLEDKMDLDNYYSNMGANLVNFGNNVQGIGKALNTAKANKIDANLISQLSRYGLTFDKDGNLVSKNK